MHYSSPIREPLIQGNRTYADITEDIAKGTEGKVGMIWVVATAISAVVALIGVLSIAYTVWKGIGVWGANRTVDWAWDITNFVWWIGIGHAGTLISAILLLFRQKWRTGVNRAAEAMTIFAVICAGLFPVFHMGRVWIAFFIFPYPNTRGPLWVNFNSPLLWDVFAISTYFTVSLLFWYTGLLPDIATVRDRTKEGSFRERVYQILSFGWTGTAKQWQRFESLSLILAGLSTPLVLSVHSIVSFDFATSVIPGWHTTIFPPYFVAGAIFSGFAMVLTLMLIARKVMSLENYITVAHVESMNKIIVLTGSIVGIAYITEFFTAWYSVNTFERWVFIRNRVADPYIFGPLFGVEPAPYWWAYWSMMTCNVISPQFFWIKALRRNLWVTFILSLVINVGMWFERFVIIVTSLHRDFLPSSWA
ncbi:MAG TPA: polysulfide reductase NrfD, partial [Chitinophagales bacterium]|nr:polysulfide reductase NrfD [Chitinophagales bacterium]